MWMASLSKYDFYSIFSRSQAWWVVFSMASMCLTCLLAAFTSEQMLLHLSSVLLILNLASATQDISVDSLAIRILDANELGAGNTIQVVAYKTGSVLVGASLLWIRDLIGWSAMWIIFSLLYLLCILLVVTLNLVPSQERTREITSENLIRKAIKSGGIFDNPFIPQLFLAAIAAL